MDVVTTLGVGDPSETMRKLSAVAEMVVVGTDRRPDNRGEGFGSVSFQIAIISHCAVAVIPVVAVIPAGRPGVASGVVVGVDGSIDSGLAVEFAINEARRMGQELVVVHADGEAGSASSSSGRLVHGSAQEPGIDGRMVLSAMVGSLTGRYPGVAVREILDLRRPPGEALLHASAHARLLAIGCKGRGGARVLLGSVAQHVLLNIHCPTLITRPALEATVPL